MELIYTAQKSGFDPDKRYRNPEHFDRAESGVEKVVVVGEWPKVVAAYEEVGAEVSIVEAQKVAPQTCAGGGGRDEAFHAEINGIHSDLKSVGLIVESFAEQRLERPEGDLGEIAGRLFQVLEAVNAGIASLQRERDGEVEKFAQLEREKAELLKQLEALKVPNPDPEVEALKVKLDAAGITYRANASRESLEKLVAELIKA
ncbi:hypothetical protein ACQKQA_10540 [Pseudomonas sp. NPDC089530]|uniref:hypothetical protein n=1 Tax=Pseudomonas sp. NPDC089530 TaxID=3390651 RepID=UPI003D06D969